MPRPKAYDPDRVLEQAAAAFQRRGFAATSVSDLTLATGLNRKSLYNEFHSKPGLIEQALGRHADRARHEWERILGASPQGLDNVIAFLESIAAGGDARACLLAMAAAETPELSDRARGVVTQAFRDLEQHLLLNLLAAGPSDPGYADTCAGMAATLVISCVGASTLKRGGAGEEGTRRSCQWLALALRRELETSGGPEDQPARRPTPATTVRGRISAEPGPAPSPAPAPTPAPTLGDSPEDSGEGFLDPDS